MKSKLLLSITAAALLAFPNINFAQAPPLGTAANFVLFSTVGALSNTGITHLTGNVGTNSGLSTGFGNVDGQMHDNDGVSAACSADLLIAYNQLNATVATFFPASLLGNGQTFVPGVYSITGAATLNLDLILDGQGNSSSVFIIQIQGPFSANANSKVKLINGALACNVFWKIEGLVSMASGTTMRGTVIANNAAINMSVGDTLEGRAMSTAGAITTNGVLAYTPIGCGSLLLTGPIAPNLLSAACYTIFSSIGPVTNVGVTNVVGDVGSDNGLTTGYNPLFVVGMIHPIPDASTAQCATDMIAIYNYLNLLPYDIELLYPAQFGNNLVLTPHTYLMNSACTFTDTLFLNAEGNANAVFLIHINGALSTSTYSKVILINGTQAKNVFWEVNGAVSINDYSVFNGTIICNNGAMDILTGVTLNGRALTTTGAINTAAITAIMPPGCGAIAPNIIVQPMPQTVCVGDSVSFTVTVLGPGLSYQWRKGNVNLVDGGNISGATTDTLTINPVTLLDAGNNYNVIVSGFPFPDDTSIYVSLIVNTPPSITSQPNNQIVCAGDTAQFSVMATGTGLTYQWRKGNVNLLNVGNISGATSSTLSINGVTILNAGNNYNVIVSGPCGADTSINVSLIVNTPPNITSQPVNQTVCAGDTVHFIVIASGTGITYQWRKGIVNLINAGNISGVTNDTLTINGATILDAANNYNVVVTGSCSPDTSINVSLVVNTPPTILLQPMNQIACAGDSVSFVVMVTGTGLTYQWMNGSTILINSGNISGATNDTLTINPAGILDSSSSYYVIITGTCGADTSMNVSLIISNPPVIVLQPMNQTVCAGDSVSFIVSATGTGLTYQWRKGNVNLINAGNISGATNDTLTINPANAGDAANNYNVIVTGICRPDTSINVSLIINTAPNITAQPGDQTVCEGSSVGFPVIATGAGLTYQWRKGNVNLINTGNISGATSAMLTINPVTLADAATNYNVIVYGTCTPNDTSAFAILAVDTTPVAVAASNSPVCIDSTINLTAQTVFGATYSWTGPNVFTSSDQNPVIVNASSAYAGTYTLTVTANGCISAPGTTTVIMNDCFPDLHIPDAFSPNGDLTNDLFVIRGIENYPNNKFVVFNRWGNEVFEASPYTNTWDGKTKMGLTIGGDDLPIGTYFYILDLGDGSPVYKGTIYLNK